MLPPMLGALKVAKQPMKGRRQLIFNRKQCAEKPDVGFLANLAPDFLRNLIRLGVFVSRHHFHPWTGEKLMC